MKYIISILLIFNISLVNANEIFNLLKIPNLKVYNTNSSNGLKYLYAENNFKIGLKKNIACDKSKRKELDEKYQIVEKNLSRYKAEFLIKNKFKNSKNIEISRFKGLGEMPPKQLRETTMSKLNRKLIKIELPLRNLEDADKNLLSFRNKRDEISNKQSQNKLAIDRLNDQETTLISEEKRLKDSIDTLASAHIAWREQSKLLNTNRQDLINQQKDLETRFGEQRRERDCVEADVAKKRLNLQEMQWSLQRLREDQKNMKEEIRMETIRCTELERKLPNPRPLISDEIRDIGLDDLLSKLEDLQKRMEELEPVNMLALEELAKLDERLNELENRLQVLTDERSELLLRIETVATLREEAFMEAFKAVDVHFREIFASLSEGDGHLQLENPEEPLEGGLTLVAHPKGKPVRRLAAMSGGEKSLTALSFLFALQRFRPSPFYALDEVDSFLDGVNVERLAALIAQQAEQAQFLVVSHRRPMIGASMRTIGVTQARGNHTQVVGLPIAA